MGLKINNPDLVGVGEGREAARQGGLKTMSITVRNTTKTPEELRAYDLERGIKKLEERLDAIQQRDLELQAQIARLEALVVKHFGQES